MFCDNCLLLFPLRVGALIWNLIILIYSAGGGYLLVTYGQFWFFTYPEYFIYGGVAFAVAAISAVSILAYSNRSIVWTRATLFCWPILLVVSAVRGILMIYQVQRKQDYIQWECDNNGTLWTAEAYINGTVSNATTTLPAGFCTGGASTLYTAMFIALLVDLGFQFYAFFMSWRYSAFLRQYAKVNGPQMGYYA